MLAIKFLEPTKKLLAEQCICVGIEASNWTIDINRSTISQERDKKKEKYCKWKEKINSSGPPPSIQKLGPDNEEDKTQVWVERCSSWAAGVKWNEKMQLFCSTWIFKKG